MITTLRLSLVLILACGCGFAQLAIKGKLLLADDFKSPAVYTGHLPDDAQSPDAYTQGFQPVAPGWRVGVWHAEWRHTANGIKSVWTEGHMPVLAYEGSFRNVIIEVDFRFAKEPGKWSACRVSAINPELNPRAYSVSVWANADDKDRPLGVVLEHDEWAPGKTTTVGNTPASFKPNRWYTLRLETINDEALVTVNGVQASGRHEKFGLPKTMIVIGTGTSPHELRRLRVWEALPAKPKP